jgi:hypothetical protein
MFRHSNASVFEIEDWSAGDRWWVAVSEHRAAMHPCQRSMNNNLLRMCDLSQSCSEGAELTADWLSCLLAQASDVRDFLPRQITRWRTGRVVRVALDGVLAATLNLVFQLTKALEESMIELTFSHKFLGLALDSLLGACEFFGERHNQRLRIARKLNLKFLNLILHPSDEAEDGLGPLVIKSENS